MNDKTNYLNSIGILTKWHDKEYKDFTNCKTTIAEINKYFDKIKKARTEGIGIYMFGANGVGKTLLLNTSFMRLLDMKYKVRIISLPTLMTLYTAQWSGDERYKTFISQPDFLGIEELGKEIKQGENELAKTVIDHTLRFRLQTQLPVWITSNVAAEKLKSVYSEDIASMLSEMCLPIHVTGKDFRKDILKENIKNFIE